MTGFYFQQYAKLNYELPNISIEGLGDIVIEKEHDFYT